MEIQFYMAARSDFTVESDLAATDQRQNGEHRGGRLLRPVLSQNYFGTILRYYFLAGAEIVPQDILCDRKKKICLSTIFC